MKATVTNKGQVTIPISIRTKAKIAPGTKLEFFLQEDGTIKVSLINRAISELKGMFKSRVEKPVSLQEMKKAISDASKKAMS